MLLTPAPPTVEAVYKHPLMFPFERTECTGRRDIETIRPESIHNTSTTNNRTSQEQLVSFMASTQSCHSNIRKLITMFY